MMVAVLVIHGIVDRMFNQQSIGYDLIVGPKGSDLQLVLSSVYRISPPIENLPYLYYLDLKADPLETKNFYDDPNYAVVQKQLHEELTKLRNKYQVK